MLSINTIKSTVHGVFKAMIKSESGQGGLFISALITMLAITFLGLSLSMTSYVNARRAVTTKQSSQLYYLAHAGIQEALASRFLPRTNYLNFLKYIGVTNNNPPLYGRSGLVHADALKPSQSNLIGVYRYVTLGGHAGVDVDTGELEEGFLTSNSINQHFYVLSKGSVCMHKETNEVGIGVITVIGDSSGTPRPYCLNSDYELEELTLLTEANLSRANDPLYDEIAGYRIYSDDNNITLPTPVFIPGTTGANQISHYVNFEDAWSSGQDFNTFPVRPTKIAFYNVSDDEVEAEYVFDIQGPTTTIPKSKKIDPRSVIRIFFNGGVDYRTLYINPKNNEAIEEDCLAPDADLEDCHIRTRRRQNGKIFGQSTLTPNLPGSTMLTILPAIGTGDVMQGDEEYQLELDAELSDWYGNKLGNNSSNGYKIIFTTDKL